MEDNERDKPITGNCGIDIRSEMERLERMKEEYAELIDKNRGKIVVKCAYWSQDGYEARVDWHREGPEDYEEYEYEKKMLASEMLHVQNQIAMQREINQHELLNKWKAEELAKKESGK